MVGMVDGMVGMVDGMVGMVDGLRWYGRWLEMAW